MVAVENQTELGPWTGADLSRTVRETLDHGADADLPNEVRFVAGIAKLIRRRLVEAGAEMDSRRLAVFLLEPIARAYKPDATPTRVPMLDNGLEEVTGRIWFVSPVVVAGSYVDFGDCDDDELFYIVTEKLNLGNVPVIIFDPRTTIPEVRFYKNGLNDPERYDRVRLNPDISLPRIFEVIDRLYRECLVTPDAQERGGTLWADNTRNRPSRNAESIVQVYLRAGLTTVFPTCTVRPEQTSVPGRLDLEIEESDPFDRAIFTRHAILELKVLRSFGSTGGTVTEQAMLKWIDKGVKQAAAYRRARGAVAAALCCFDMRLEDTGETSFEHVADLAQRIEVALKRWFIYATSEDYREALTA